MRRDVFQAIADPTRRSILSILAQQEMTPNTLAEHFDSSRQAVSKHLKDPYGMRTGETTAVRQGNILLFQP